eukprot:gene30345-37547_t
MGSKILHFARASLSAHPYAPLSQKYEQCTNDVYQTLVNQAGIAIGNVQIVAPICVILLMLISIALDAYAMSLLLARDAHLKTQSFHNNHSIIALIAEEL